MTLYMLGRFSGNGATSLAYRLKKTDHEVLPKTVYLDEVTGLTYRALRRGGPSMVPGVSGTPAVIEWMFAVSGVPILAQTL